MVKIGTVDPLSILERKDKWFLGGGKGAIYAPPFPRWLEKPGFWDECFYADIKLTRLFTVLFCASEGRPTRLRGELLLWRPDRMIVEHRSESHLIRETRLVTEAHEWVSVFELLSGPNLQAFLWALPEMLEPGFGAPWQSLTSCTVNPDFISYQFATAWPAEVEPDRSATEDERVSGEAAMLEPMVLNLTLGVNLPRISHTVNLAQRHNDSPLWETSLLPQKLRNGRLPGDFKLEVGPPPVEGLVHIFQQYELKSGEPLVVWCRASIPSPFPKGEGTVGGGELPSTAGGGAGEGVAGQTAVGLGPEVVSQNELAWRDFFASVPQFSSSDPYLTAAYWYRWYGIRLNTVEVPELPICTPDAQRPMPSFSPFVTEGVGFFRNFVTYSAQAHLREVAWMHSPRLGLGILENLAKCQREDGNFPGHNYSCRPPRDFYHADFATGADLLDSLHPETVSQGFLNAFVRYGSYFLDNRLYPADPNIYSVFDQNETGQEYMSRYQFASEDADKWATFVVGGVDATTYAATMLDYLARKVGGESSGRVTMNWDDKAEQTIDCLLEDLFDAEAGFFCDYSRGNLSPSRPATGFYPFLLAGQEDWLARCASYPLQKAMDRWLLNPEEFWLPKGFPATALSDPTFSADAEWKDKRLNCPWNGRSWPMVNSHLVDAIANVARMTPSPVLKGAGGGGSASPSTVGGGVGEGGERQATDLRAKAGEALMKAVTLMFHDGDPARPNSYEHYDPFTGTPSLYRGYDDYMHSWIVDLILRHAVGVQPGGDEVDPLPLGVDWIECTDIPHPRGRMSVRIEGDRVQSVRIEPLLDA